MKFDLKFLENINIGIILCNATGEAEYTNKYIKSFLGDEVIDVFKIFPEIKEKEVINSDFRVITKKYKNNLFLLFPLVDEGERIGYLILLKNKEYFNSIFNNKTLYDIKDKYSFENVIGNSPQIKKVIEECKKISDNNSNILITGESGTGKEFFARAIHNNSSRKDYPFIPINCGAIPKDLIESELFGYEAGAFTGANKQGHTGKFELANGGTIFLDEIGEMPLNMQVTLLRVLQDKCVTKIGSKKCNHVDVRIIAATNKDLKRAINEGSFRRDLYYRLNSFNVHIPPLKERIGDIPIFLEYLLKEKSSELNKPIPKMSENLFQKVISYCWPGNIRELENFVENFVVLDGISTYDINFAECHCMTHDNLGNAIKMEVLGQTSEGQNIIEIKKIENTESSDSVVLSFVELEIREIKKAIRVFNGNMTKVAEALGISRNALYNKIKKYEIIY